METEISGCCSNRFWDKVRNANGNKEYPSNMGQKWSDEEEVSLLEELSNNIEIDIIAQKHNRTVGGIESRRQEIAYKMYIKNMSIEEIIEKTKLDSHIIKQIIEKKQNTKKMKEKNDSKKLIEEIEPSFHYIELQNDVNTIKKDINEIKSTLRELLEMMKAVYEFEDC